MGGTVTRENNRTTENETNHKIITTRTINEVGTKQIKISTSYG